jgi:broad specificity phosphatase PhoE
MSYTLKRQLPRLAGPLTTLVLFSNAYGQSAADATESEQLQEVVVTAERRATNLQTTPIAVTALGGNILTGISTQSGPGPGTLYLVRHGQACFGTDDYDRLTDLGMVQARRLGAYFASRKIRFKLIQTGTLRRHLETAEAILEGRSHLGDLSSSEQIPALDEYDSEAVIGAVFAAPPSPQNIADSRDPDNMRRHFRMLKKALLAWAEARSQPTGLPIWHEFQSRAVAAVIEAGQRCPDGNLLVVSSGGPISAIIAAALLAPPQTAVELNLRLRNSSLSELALSPRRHRLVTFNTLPHLDAHLDPSLITYA